MKILFAGGGTGGHITPGIAVTEAVSRLAPDARYVFAVAGRAAEDHFLAGSDFHVEIIRSPRSGGPLLSRIAMPFRLLWTKRKCGPLLKEIAPDVVVGLGGYASVPVVWAAHSLGIPTVLIEQNAVPGRATRFLESRAGEIYGQFGYTATRLKGRARFLLTGTPVREAVVRADRRLSAGNLKLDPARRTILILGGSQGARGLNDLVLGLLPDLERDYGVLQIIHQTGALDFERVRDAYAKTHLDGRVLRFINPVAPALHCADVVIARAGATGIAEITALGLPSVLVPYPHSMDGEQRANAMQLVRRGAAFMVEESGGNARDNLYSVLGKLLDEGDLAREMAGNAAEMGLPEAAKTVAKKILALAGYRENKEAAKTPLAAGV